MVVHFYQEFKSQDDQAVIEGKQNLTLDAVVPGTVVLRTSGVMLATDVVACI